MTNSSVIGMLKETNIQQLFVFVILLLANLASLWSLPNMLGSVQELFCIQIIAGCKCIYE